MESRAKVSKSIKILLFFLFIINSAAALWAPLFSVFIIKNIVGATLAIIGITSALYSVTKSFLQIPIARYLDAHAGEKDDFWVLFTGILVASLSSFGLLFVARIWQLGSIQILWGVADACTMAAYYAIFSHHLDQRSAAFEWSLYSVGGITVANAIGGLVGGFVAQAFGFSALFAAAGVMNLGALFILGAFYPYINIMRPAKTPTDEAMSLAVGKRSTT
ncbi:MAG: MFS transporter [Patescibacteria group bacterium]|nr:MFS transporter [Patescibacteria group bacterium]